MKLPRAMKPACSSRKKSGVLLVGTWFWFDWWATSFWAMLAESEGEVGAGGKVGGPSDEGLYVVGEEVLLRLGGWLL